MRLASHLVSLTTLLPVLVQASFAFADVTSYPRVPGDPPNTHYTVTVNDTAVESVATTMDVGYAHFAFSGSVRVEIAVNEPIRTFNLSPHRLNIDAEAAGNVLSFTIDRPRKLHLRINDLPRFFIFADGPEEDAPQPGDTGVFVLTDLGVRSDPDTVQTQQLQAAIDHVAANKGTLYVPPGIYVAGKFELRGDMSLYLAPGSIIKGTARLEDYPAYEQIRIDGARNIRVFGRGVLDGNGRALRDPYLPDRKPGRERLFAIVNCTGIEMRDVIFRDAAVWNVHLIASRNATFDNLKIISMSRSEGGPDMGYNTDGIDPDNSSDVLIQNCFFSLDDDPIAVKLKTGDLRDMSNIVFRDNIIWCMTSALKIGTEVHEATVRDVTFENNDIVHADTGMSVYCYKGGYVDGARWINNYFEQIAVVPNNSPHSKSCNIYVTTRSETQFGEVRNLLFKDNTFETFGPNPSQIRANGSTQVVDGIIIDNLVIAGEKRDAAGDARINIGAAVRNVEFK